MKSADAAAPPSGTALALRWAALMTLSLAFIAGLEALRIPAALLLAPMIAAIILAAAGVRLRVVKPAFLSAQAIVGCMIASSITPAILAAVAAHWALLLAIILAVIVGSSLLGWLLARLRVLPGSAAVWGSSPGAASAMTLMAGAHGADMRLVAFMQYLRVVFVALAATLVARIWVDPHASAAAAVDWLPPVSLPALAETVALAIIGGALGRYLRIPAGSLLVPLVAGAVLHGTGLVALELPPWLLAPSYMLIGWNIGLGFTPAVLNHAARAMPRVIAGILAQIATCSGLAYLLTRLLGVDALTAYLATSPGGADSVAIIAASSHVDVAFIMAMQTSRLFLVILISPYLARFIVRRLAASGIGAEPAI